MELLSNERLPSEIKELQSFHTGLSCVKEKDNNIYISGPLPFNAHCDGRESIASCFDVALCIGKSYPEVLPVTRETGRAIKESYRHVNDHGTLCLAVPVEERLIFGEEPTLMGYVNRLLIPYFYGYRYWEKHGKHPFGERAHGEDGVVQYYVEEFGLKDESKVLDFLMFLRAHGYEGRRPCPCGSGNKIKKCRHGKVLRKFDQHHIRETVQRDLGRIITRRSITDSG